MLKVEIKKEQDIIELRLILENEEWKYFLDLAKKEIYKNLELKGFRKGKVPEEVASKYVKESEIFSEAINLVVDKKNDEVMKKIQEYNIITKPSLSIEAVSNNSVTLLFMSHLLPNVKLPDYLNFEIKYIEKDVTEEDIENELNKIRNLFVEQVQLGKDHKIENGDNVNLNFVGTVDGVEFEGGNAENFDLQIGSKSFIDNFEDQLIGLKSGDEKSVLVTFPKEYPVEELASKKAEFKVKINSISREEEISSEKLKEKLSKFGFTSKEEIRNQIKEMLIETSKQEAADKYFNNLVDKISEHKDTIIKIPEVLLKSEIEHQFEHFKEDLQEQQMSLSEYLKVLDTTEEKFKEENLRQNAERRIIEGFIYTKLVEDNGISNITKEEFEEEYRKIASLQKMKIEEVKEQLPENKLHDSLMFLKLIKLLRSKMDK